MLVLDAFSGRTNPEWELTETEIDGLAAMIDALPRSAATTEPATGLGFRGFQIVSSTPGSDEMTIVDVHPTTVVVRVPEAAARVSEDPDGTVMRAASEIVADKTSEDWIISLLDDWLG